MSHDSPRHLVPSGLQPWISPRVPARTDSKPSSAETSSSTMPELCPLALSPNVVENGDLDQDVKRRRLSRLGWPSLLQRQLLALRHKSNGSLSKDDDSCNPVTHCQPHPEQWSPSNDSPNIPSPLNDSISIHSSQLEQDTSWSPSPDSECSSSPSLVPTIIASCPPSPQPHNCIAEAKTLGIKVRDFAHETHGVALAPSIPDIDQLKASYNLYRNAGLTPPSETIRKLQIYDPEWLMDAKRRYDTLSAQLKPTSGITIFAWRGETEKWRGFEEESPGLGNAVHSDETA